MKKALSLLLALALCLSLVACGGDSTKEPDGATTAPTEGENIPVSKLGETIESDILRITLTNAQFTIKLNSSASGTLDQIQSGQTTLSDKYFTAEEYDPNKHSGSAYVAAKGHTYIAIEYKAENLDRASVNFDGSFNVPFITVEYGGNTYPGKTTYGCSSENGFKWVRYQSQNILLLAGEQEYYRCYIDIPTDVSNLDDDFTLVFSLPNSSGKVTKFKYHVKAEDRTIIESQEISVEEAVYSFTKEEGQEYFKKHMSEYSSLTGSEITSLVNGKTWNMTIKSQYGSWVGKFKYESSGRIKETIPNIGTGYYNDRTWKVSGNKLILDGTDTCEVRKINNNTYLLVQNGLPYAIMN